MFFTIILQAFTKFVFRTSKRIKKMIGETILHYKILEKLGEGGMGIVYLAEDLKLERKVAIKFLPHHVSANAEDRERFKIEAKAAASLNHSNIATIHAIEEFWGRNIYSNGIYRWN